MGVVLSPLHRRSLVARAALLLGLVGSTALAQNNSGFAIDRYEPSERGSEWFSNESLDLRGHLRPAVGLTLDWGYRPLVLYRDDGDEAIIEHQLFGHLGGSFVLYDRLRLGLNVPLALYQAGTSGTVSNTSFSSDNSTTIGDVRLGADVRLLGSYGGPAQLALGAQVFLPTGSRDSFTGDGKVRVAPRLMLSGDISQFTYAARVGFTYRAQNAGFAGAVTGNELSFGVAAGARLLEGKLVVGPELTGTTVVEEGNAFFARRETPVEVLVGAHYRVDSQWRVGAGVGPGLTRGIGAPQVRALATVEWHPDVEQAPPPPEPEAPKDRDLDGVLDAEDACVDVPGVRTEDPKTNGCPLPKDTDGDGVIDAEDACVDVPGVRTEDPKTNGCPPDRDGDKILDAEDACPDEPGVRTEDPKTNGCPPPKDTDGDGILDPEDACPEVAGPADPDPKKNGCPKARIDKGQIRILERVEFETGKATLRPESNGILTAVLEVMQSNPTLTKVSIEGHTDSVGNDKANQALSQRRAAAVVKWLTTRGIAASRLASKGFGESRPIDSNDTPEGRQNNRRVEFHIVEVDGKPVPAAEEAKAP